MGKRTAINKLGQHHLSQIEIDDRLSDCEELISIYKANIDAINREQYYGYVIDRIVLFNLYSLPQKGLWVQVLNPYRYTVRIPGAVQFNGYVGPSANIRKNNQLQTSTQFDIKPGDVLEFALFENKFLSFTDSIASFVIKYKISKNE